MESMTNAPYYLMKARNGYRMGNDKIIDGMIHDGLWDPYGNKHMGVLAEECAREYKVTRQQQDEYPKKVNFEKAFTLKPVFEKDGTVTAFNASNINDGAAAVVMMSKSKAES